MTVAAMEKCEERPFFSFEIYSRAGLRQSMSAWLIFDDLKHEESGRRRKSEVCKRVTEQEKGREKGVCMCWDREWER